MIPGLLVRGVFRSEALRFAFADTSNLCSQGIVIHDCDPASGEVLCDLLTASALTTVLLDDEEKYSILIDYKGGIAGKWLADTDSECHVRALPGNIRLSGAGDADAVFGTSPATIRVLKFKQGQVLNSGEVAVSMASPAQDLAMFFNLSDQVETQIACTRCFAPDPAAPVKFAAGIMLQALPDCDLEAFAKVREKMETPEFQARLADMQMPFEVKMRELAAFAGLDSSPENFFYEGAGNPVYHCGCSADSMKRALLTLGKDGIEDLMKERGEAHIQCRFCHKDYTFKPGDIL